MKIPPVGFSPQAACENKNPSCMNPGVQAGGSLICKMGDFVLKFRGYKVTEPLGWRPADRHSFQMPDIGDNLS